MSRFEIELDAEQCRKICDDATKFAQKHVVELCEEMREWDKTAILRDGRVRELANDLRPVAGHSALSVAESYVRVAAFDFVIQQGKKTT